MKTKYLVRFVTALLALSLAACDLPEITPPATEEVITATPDSEAVPLPSATIIQEDKPLMEISSENISQLELAHKTAVSNIQQVTWANDGKSLSVITQNSDANGSLVYGVTTLDSSALAPLALYSTTGDRISSISSDGHTVAVISQDMTALKLVDMAAGNTEIHQSTPGYLVGGVSFSPDLRYISVTKMDSWEVVLLDYSTREAVKTLSGFETAAPIFDASFTSSARWIAWHARATLQLQDVDSGSMGPSFSHEDFINDYVVSADGTMAACAVGTSVKLWDVASGSQIKSLEAGSYISSLDFSPDDSLLAVSAGNDLQLWDVASGTLLTTLSGHSDSVMITAFSPDQKSIATAGMDNQLYLWQIAE